MYRRLPQEIVHRLFSDAVLTNEQEIPTNDEEVYTQEMLKDDKGNGKEFADQP